MTPRDLVTRWREQASAYDKDGQPGARLLTRVARELEQALVEVAEPLLSLNEAAQQCGYSPDHLGRLLKAGKLTNHGTRRRPLVRSADLPRKPQLTPREQLGIVRAQ